MKFNPDNPIRFIHVTDVKEARAWMKANKEAYNSRMIECDNGLFIQYYHRSLDRKPGSGRIA